MILTGIIVTALSVILMIVSMAGIFGSAATDSGKGFGIAFASYIITAIGYIVGLALIAIGLAQHFNLI